MNNIQAGLIPSGWVFEPLCNRASVVMGQSPPGNTYNESGAGEPLINGPVEFGKRFPTKIQWTTAPARLCEDGDILFCVRGSTTGRMNVSDGIYCIGRGVAAIRGIPGSTFTPYLEYLLQQVANAIFEDARGSGSTFPSITGPRLATWKLLFPPTPEQRKIARILATLDSLIEKTEALIAKYQAIKQGMMHDLFTRGVDAHGHLRPPRAEAPDLYKQSELGWIPDSWTVRPLGEVAEVGGGVTLGRDLSSSQVIELPYLRVANVQDGYLDLSEIKTVAVLKSEVDRFCLQTGDMLMTEGGDFDKLGRGTVWRGQISPCLHQNHIFRVRPTRDTILPDFLASVTASSHGKRYFLVSSKQTTNLATINSTQLKAFPVPLPSLEEQSRIVARLAAVEKQIETEQRYLNQFRQVKTGLMQDLLTGKVRVNVDEAEEVAANG